MRTRNNYITVVLIGAGLAFVYLLAKILLMTASVSNTYANYSSLRADPMGTKALYDSLSELGDLQVWRSFKPLIRMRGTTATVLHLALQENGFGALLDWEEIASSGGRVIIGVDFIVSKDTKGPKKGSSLEQRLGLQFVRPDERQPVAMIFQDAADRKSVV